MIAGARRVVLRVDRSDDRRSWGILNSRAEARQPVDRARPVEHAQNAFPTRSLDGAEARAAHTLHKALSFSACWNENNTGRILMRSSSREDQQIAVVVASLR